MLTSTRLLALATGSALLLGLAACSAEEKAVKSGSWTVLSYSIADTDLEPYMMDDVAEMGTVGTQGDLNIVALVDRSADYTADDVLGQGDWVGGKLLEVTEGGADELEDMGDVNTGDPQVLADFITRGINDYPADNYALIISDHGASWPGVGGDESFDGDGLDLEEINLALADGLAGTDVEKLDLLGFDACLMATYEVASKLAPHAERLLASQELEPGHGWDYTALQTIPDNGGATVDELGSALIAGFEAQAVDQETEAEITLALIDLNAIPAVDAALSAFSAALVERAAGIAPVVGRSLASALGFGRNPDPEQDVFMTDLAILAGDIGVDALDVSDESDDLIRAINDSVLDKVDGQATKGATGLSIYFPPTETLYSTDYDALGVDGGWAEFLAAYYGAGSDVPEESHTTFAEGDAEVDFDADGVNVTASFDADGAENISEAFIRYGTVDADGSVTFLGREPADFDDDGEVVGSYDLSQMTISDGEDTTGAYLDMTIDGDVVTFDVPMTYYAPEAEEGTDALLSLVIDGDELISETYYTHNVAAGTYGALSADPEGIISPELLNVDAGGAEQWISTSDYGLYADLPNLEYDFTDLESGTELYLELQVVDFSGNVDTIAVTVEVP